MERLIEFVTENPLYAIGVVVLTLMLLVALVKRALKTAILALLLIAGYLYYLHESAEKHYARGQEKLEGLTEEAPVPAKRRKNCWMMPAT